MNDPALSSTLSPSALSSEEPRSWLRHLWYRLLHFLRPPADAEVLREVVAELAEEPLSESGISQAERMLLVNIIALRERKVSDSMVQRADIIAADISSNLNELLDLMAAHGHSRIPIYRDTLDDVIGMVHMKDIIPCLAYQQMRAIADLLRPVMFVAPSMPASKLLLQMRQTRQHMALVVDEFGGIDGLVTIEDLVEEIVGEIEDEHDAPSGPPIIARADGTLLVDARLTLEEFSAQTGVVLPSQEGEDVDTLGGYVAHMAGRVPQIGEKITCEGCPTFEVLEMDQSRIKRLRIRAVRRADDKVAKIETKRSLQTVS